MEPIYKFSLLRNKGEISLGTLKKRLMKENNLCYICNQSFRILELEHPIPIALCGDIFKQSNIKLICRKCHKRKSEIDRLIISFFSRSKIISRQGIETLSLININQLQELYKMLFDLINKSNIKFKEYIEGDNIYPIYYTQNSEVPE